MLLLALDSDLSPTVVLLAEGVRAKLDICLDFISLILVVYLANQLVTKRAHNDAVHTVIIVAKLDATSVLEGHPLVALAGDGGCC